MNVLIINASPKGARSNTMKITDAFVEGMKNASECRVRNIALSRVKISPCIGCFSCWRQEQTPGRCVLSDDCEYVFDYMLAADVVIWSFPLYFFGVPSKLKALLERQLYLNTPFMSGDEAEMLKCGHKFRLDTGNKKYVLISSCGFYFTPSTYSGVTGQFDMIYGSGGYEKIFCGEGELLPKPYLKKKIDRYLEIARKAGAEYAVGGITAETRAQIDKKLYPTKFYADIADKSWGITNEDFAAADAEIAERVEKLRRNF